MVTGSPQLQLETGSTDRYAIYSSGSGTNTLSFQYTVQAGDSSADLDQHSSSALTLNGGTIKDAAGNNAILTLANPGATGSLAANAQLVIDGTAPTANLTSITDDVGSVTGLLASSARTDDSSLVFAGTNESGSSVAIYNGSTLLGNATVTATSWTYTATIANATTYDFNVKETDSAGNTSAATSNFTITGDTTAPTGSLGSYATSPAYSADIPNPYGIRDVGGLASPTLADIDGDGDLDLFIGNQDGNTLLFTNTAASGSTTPAYSAAVTNPYGITDVGAHSSPALADIDGDGDLDLFIGNKDGNTLIFTNTAAVTVRKDDAFAAD